MDYVLVVDNSGSISGEGRDFAREAVKLFVELADSGDQISLVAFDTSARSLASIVLCSLADRAGIERAAELGITFAGPYTDISRPLQMVLDRRGDFLRGAGHQPVIVLMSDGRLDVTPHAEAQAAFNRIRAILNGGATGLPPVYAIGLGAGDIYDVFVPGITGMSLLRDTIAGKTDGKFYYASSVGQLIDIYMTVLRVTKGISNSELGSVFRADSSVNRISAIILKRTATGQTLCNSNQIILETPVGASVTCQSFGEFGHSSTRIAWQATPYYDLVDIVRPSPGAWRFRLSDGSEPHVVGLMKADIRLCWSVEKAYQSAGEKVIKAWLLDDRQRRISKRSCAIKARLDVATAFNASMHDVTLAKTRGDTFSYVMSDGPGFSYAPGRYFLQIRAEQEGSFFLRISDTISTTIEPSYFSFVIPRRTMTRDLAIGWKGVRFAASVDVCDSPRFGTVPEVLLALERVPRRRSALRLDTLCCQPSARGFEYAAYATKLTNAHYAGQYTLVTRLPVTLERREEHSERFDFVIRNSPWLLWLGLLALAAAVLPALVCRFAQDYRAPQAPATPWPTWPLSTAACGLVTAFYVLGCVVSVPSEFFWDVARCILFAMTALAITLWYAWHWMVNR
jgi:hypothetical protein